MREASDRCLTLWKPVAEWNLDKSMQSRKWLGKWGQRNTAPGLLVHGKADSWLTSRLPCCLRFPQMPHKGPAHNCAVNRPWWALRGGDERLGSHASHAEKGTQQPGLRVRCQAPSKAPCHFLLGLTCPAESTWKCTPSACPTWKPHPLSLLFSILTPVIGVTSLWVAIEVIHVSINTNLFTN